MHFIAKLMFNVLGSSSILTCRILNTYLFWFFPLCLPARSYNRYSIFKIRHVQIDELPMTQVTKNDVCIYFFVKLMFNILGSSLMNFIYLFSFFPLSLHAQNYNIYSIFKIQNSTWHELPRTQVMKWYFVTKIVLTYCEKKLF